MKYFFYSFLFCLGAISLNGQTVSYPAAEGFNVGESDVQAIALADEVMQAMGGYEAWNNTHFLRWTFFGKRTLIWDKWAGNVRIDIPETNNTYLLNVHSGEGQVWLAGIRQSKPDTISKYLDRAKSIWINDSYWLVMPYKLKDSGVSLKYLEKIGEADSLRHKLQLTFQEVGNTPDNKYWVFVNDKNKLVDEWQFFSHFEDDEARFSTPWDDYSSQGGILLGGGRGRGQLTDIGAFMKVPENIFSTAEAYSIENWE